MLYFQLQNIFLSSVFITLTIMYLHFFEFTLFDLHNFLSFYVIRSIYEMFPYNFFYNWFYCFLYNWFLYLHYSFVRTLDLLWGDVDIPVTSALEKWSQEGQELHAVQDCIVSFRPAWTTWDTVSKQIPCDNLNTIG